MEFLKLATAEQYRLSLIENPLIWARYLRVELLTHFGAEYYCPVSLLRVHGTTMMEEFNHEVKGLRSEDDAEDEVEDTPGTKTSVQLSDFAAYRRSRESYSARSYGNATIGCNIDRNVGGGSLMIPRRQKPLRPTL